MGVTAGQPRSRGNTGTSPENNTCSPLFACFCKSDAFLRSNNTDTLLEPNEGGLFGWTKI